MKSELVISCVIPTFCVKNLGQKNSIIIHIPFLGVFYGSLEGRDDETDLKGTDSSITLTRRAGSAMTFLTNNGRDCIFVLYVKSRD